MTIFKTQSGSALIFILIAIALLGLLTVSMIKSSSDSNDTGNYEFNLIQANEILDYSKSIETAVQSLLARGCSENEISFWNDGDGNGIENNSDEYFNTNSPSDYSCHVFRPEGAGVSSMEMKNIFSKISYSTGTKALTFIGENNNSDLWIRFITPASKIDQVTEICRIINKSQGIIDNDTTTVNFEPYMNGAWTNTLFQGNFFNDSSPNVNPDLQRKETFCAGHNSGGMLSFYHVLIAR